MIVLILFLLVMIVFFPHIVLGVIGMYIAVYGTLFIIGQINYFLHHGKFASLSKDDPDASSRPMTKDERKVFRLREKLEKSAPHTDVYPAKITITPRTFTAEEFEANKVWDSLCGRMDPEKLREINEICPWNKPLNSRPR